MASVFGGAGNARADGADRAGDEPAGGGALRLAGEQNRIVDGQAFRHRQLAGDQN